jgi:signal transduction histidine kinase
MALYLDDPQSRRARLAGWILYPLWSLVLLLNLFTDLVETTRQALIPFEQAAGPLENPARILGGALLIWLILEFRKMRNATTGIKRTQRTYLYYGTVLFGGGAAVVAGFLQPIMPELVDPDFTAFFSLPWVAFTVYSITRYRLFDIRLVVSRALGILLLSVIGAAIHIILFKLMEPELGSVHAILISLMIIGFGLFGTPASIAIQQWVARVILMDRFAYQKTLSDAARAFAVKLDMRELLSFIIDITRQSLRVKKAAIFLRGARGFYMDQADNVGVWPPPAGAQGVDGNTVAQVQADPGGVLDPDATRWMERTGKAIAKEELDSSSAAPPKTQCLKFMDAAGAELIIPLLFKGQLRGLLALGPRESNVPYDRSDIDLLETLAVHAAVALENARLHEESLRHCQARLEEEQRYAREKEKIIKDLHDGIGGIMTSIGSIAQMALCSPGGKDAADKLCAIAELAKTGASETRGFMGILDDRNLTWDGLLSDFTYQGYMVIEPHGMTFDLTSEVDGACAQPGSLLCLNLFMIYKEALTNIVKHARACAVKVCVRVSRENLTLSVADDGVGFVRERAGGRGFANIKSRAEDLGGSATITSDRGTCVRVEIPIRRGSQINKSMPCSERRTCRQA